MLHVGFSVGAVPVKTSFMPELFPHKPALSWLTPSRLLLRVVLQDTLLFMDCLEVCLVLPCGLLQWWQRDGRPPVAQMGLGRHALSDPPA